MFVYRLEDDDGLGPYVGRCAGEKAAVSCYKSTPTPDEDEKLSPLWDDVLDKHRYYFGFVSMEQLKRWFPPEKWHKLKAYNQRHGYNYAIYMYEIDYRFVLVGDYQVVFKRREAIKKSRHIGFEDCVATEELELV